MGEQNDYRKMSSLWLLTVGAEFLLSLWALSDNSLTLLETDLSLQMQITVYLQSFVGWNIGTLILALGLAGIFATVFRKKQRRTPWVSAFSVFFALCTVLGKSYVEIGSWDYIFHSGLQFGLACSVFAGYYFVYKNSILFGLWVLVRMPMFFRREACGKIENWLFERHPFWGPAMVIWVFAIPWLVCFFPGTLEPDARHQLFMALGVSEMTGHHPVFVTKLMGTCLYIGRILFGSDNIGMFIYTFPQFVIQSLVMAYAVYVLSCMKAPMVLRWGALALYSIYPIFPIWGYTLVKDTGYYIFMLLFVTILVHVLGSRKSRPVWWQVILFVLSAAGLGIFRNDGRYVVVLTCICGLILCRKYSRVLLLGGAAVCLLSVFLIEGVYMESRNIPKGSIREVLTIPLQQTARYVKEHYEEITPEEAQILQEGFEVELSELANLYTPEVSDPVKGVFALYPDTSYLKAYFHVWVQQMLKHPDTYIQAFFNQIYGYIYPEKESLWDGIAVFSIEDAQRPHWQYMNLTFGIKNGIGRRLLIIYAHLIKVIPVVGILYSPGIYTYILLGCMVFLTAKKKWRELVVYLPGLCVLIICMASPVTACLRYVLPNIVSFPLYLAWCYHVVRSQEVMRI